MVSVNKITNKEPDSHESIIHIVREFKDINPRTYTITLRTNNMDVVLINVYVPTDEKDEEEK